MIEHAVDTDLTRGAVLAMGKGGDLAKFLTLADGALAAAPDDLDLRLLLISRLAEQGLLYRAARVADLCPAEMQSNPDFAGMLQHLRTPRNNGLASWQRFGRQFDANIEALGKRYDWTGEVVAAWRTSRDHLELHRATSSLWQVFDREFGSGGGWRPVFGDHNPQPAAKEQAARLKNQILPPFVIDGVDLGFQLPWLYEATADTLLGANAVLYQIEQSFLALAVALHLSDWREPIADERVHIHCGPDAVERFERLVETDIWNVTPLPAVRTIPWEPRNAEGLEERISELQARSEAGRVALQDSIGEQYHGRDRAWWHRRYAEALDGKGPPLRVMGITSRFTTVLQYSMRDAMKALKALGCETRLLIEPDNHSRLSPQRKLGELRDFEPDLVFLIDHTRHGQRKGMIDAVPVVTWLQDKLDWLYCREAGESMGPLDFCMGFGRDELVQRYCYPADRFMPCGMATDPTVMGPRSGAAESPHTGDIDDQTDSRLACDVAFATNYPDRAILFTEASDLVSGGAGVPARQTPIKKLLDAMHEELLDRSARGVLNGGLAQGHFLRAMEQKEGIELWPEMRTQLLQEFVGPMTDRLIRLQTIEWAADWAKRTGRRLHLYGNGWDKHPQYASCARGFLKHGPELGRAFRAAKVSLHAGVNQAFHQRVLDGLAAGGFFLIRRHADDVGERLRPAISRIVVERNLGPGDKIGLEDLPAAFREFWIADRRMRGIDPCVPYEVGAAEIYREEGLSSAEAARTPMRIWPDFGRVTFDSREELEDRLEWFLHHDDQRQAIAESMREAILGAFSYQAPIRRLLSWMTEVLGSAEC